MAGFLVMTGPAYRTASLQLPVLLHAGFALVVFVSAFHYVEFFDTQASHVQFPDLHVAEFRVVHGKSGDHQAAHSHGSDRECACGQRAQCGCLDCQGRHRLVIRFFPGLHPRLMAVAVMAAVLLAVMVA
jgi:hypothetical protein